MNQLNTYTEKELQDSLILYEAQNQFMQEFLYKTFGAITRSATEKERPVLITTLRRNILNQFLKMGFKFEDLIKMAVAKGFFNIYWIQKTYKYIIFDFNATKNADVAVEIMQLTIKDSEPVKKRQNRANKKWREKEENKYRLRAYAREYKAKTKLKKELKNGPENDFTEPNKPN